MTDPIKLTFVVTNTKLKSRHALECELGNDCIDLERKAFEKEYGKHVLKAIYDLLQHPAFKAGQEKPKSNLIIAP